MSSSEKSPADAEHTQPLTGRLGVLVILIRCAFAEGAWLDQFTIICILFPHLRLCYHLPCL